MSVAAVSIWFMPEPLGSIKNPEFVPIAELHRRDRLPGYYTIAGTVERAHVYEDDYPCWSFDSIEAG